MAPWAVVFTMCIEHLANSCRLLARARRDRWAQICRSVPHKRGQLIACDSVSEMDIRSVFDKAMKYIRTLLILDNKTGDKQTLSYEGAINIVCLCC